MNIVEYRQLERNGYCKVCGKLIEQHRDKVIVAQNWRLQKIGQLILCDDCIKLFYDYISGGITDEYKLV